MEANDLFATAEIPVAEAVEIASEAESAVAAPARLEPTCSRLLLKVRMASLRAARDKVEQQHVSISKKMQAAEALVNGILWQRRLVEEQLLSASGKIRKMLLEQLKMLDAQVVALLEDAGVSSGAAKEALAETCG